MNRKEIASSMAQRTGTSPADAERHLAAFEEVILDAIGRGEKVQLPGLLTVERVERAARSGRNPQTGDPMQIPAGFGVKATPGSRLKAATS